MSEYETDITYTFPSEDGREDTAGKYDTADAAYDTAEARYDLDDHIIFGHVG